VDKINGGIFGYELGNDYISCMIYRIIFYMIIIILLSFLLVIIREIVMVFPKDHPMYKLVMWIKRLFK
jgi:hypothetical protein